MRVCVCGSHDYTDLDRVRAFVRGLEPGTVVCARSSTGVDEVALAEAKKFGLMTSTHYSTLEGPGSAWLRNRRLARDADQCVAFWTMNTGGGTSHLIGCFERLAKDVLVIPDAPAQMVAS